MSNNIEWNDAEMQAAILQILADARQRKPKSGGASTRLIADVLGVVSNYSVLLRSIQRLEEEGLIEKGEHVYLITVEGFDRLAEILKGKRPLQTSHFLNVLHLIANSKQGMSASEILSALKTSNVDAIELPLWYCVQKGYLEAGEVVFTITESGRHFLAGQDDS